MNDTEFNAGCIGLHAHPRTLAIQSPVGTERYFYAASWTTCGTSPKVCLGMPLGSTLMCSGLPTFLWEQSGESSQSLTQR